MFESLKARMLVWAANKTDVLLLPDNRNDREIAESMFVDGIPNSFINKTTLNLWKRDEAINQSMFQNGTL